MAVTSGTQIKPHKNQMAANLLPYWWRSPPCVDLKKIFIALKAWSLVMLRSSWQNELVYTLDSVIGNIAVFWDNKEQDTVPLGAKVISAECDMWSKVHSDQWPTVLPLGQWTRIQSPARSAHVLDSNMQRVHLYMVWAVGEAQLKWMVDGTGGRWRDG